MESEETTMDHSEVTALRLVDRYLLGTLEAEEAQRFERHYLACPDCLAELETTEQLVDGLRDAATEDVGRAVGSAVGVGLVARLARLSPFHRFATYAALAALMLAPAALLYSRLGAVNAELGTTRLALGAARTTLAAARATQAAIAVLPLNALRGAGDPAGSEASRQIRLGEMPGWVILALELDRPTHATFRATLNDAGGTELWHGDDLLLDGSDTLTLTVHSSKLDSGAYTVAVSGLGDDGRPVPIASFGFRVAED